MLANRHISVSGQCPVCARGAKDIKHLLLSCQRAKKIWQQLGLEASVDKACLLYDEGRAILEFLLSSKSLQEPVLGLGATS